VQKLLRRTKIQLMLPGFAVRVQYPNVGASRGEVIESTLTVDEANRRGFLSIEKMSPAPVVRTVIETITDSNGTISDMNVRHKLLDYDGHQPRIGKP